MDQREISRIKIKFGKFLDPFIILTTVLIILLSILSVRSLTPRAFLQQESPNVLGVEESFEEGSLELVQGEHNYITSETLKKTTSNLFKYTTIVKPRELGIISKPIIKIENVESLKIQLAYTNSTNSKISLFDKNNNTSYILQNLNQTYSPNIEINEKSETIYLLVENSKSVFFNQYIEINFFLNP